MTKHKKATILFEEQKEQLRLYTEMSNIAVWEHDFMTNSMSRTSNHDALYGLPWQDALNIDTFLNATHPADREFSNAIIQNSVKPGGPDKYQFDFRVIFPDHTVRWLEVKGQVIERNKLGEGIVVRGCLIDISARKQTEQDLLDSELKYYSFFQNSMDAILITNPSGSILSANPAACQMFGYTEEEFTAIGRDDLADVNDPKLSEILAEREQSGKVSGELILLKKDGAKFLSEISSAIFLDTKGCRRASMIIRDISGRKASEEKLHQEKEKFTKAFHAGPAGLTITRISDGKFVDVNDAFLEIFEFEREEVIGHTSLELNIWTVEERKKIIELQLKTGGLESTELVVYSKTGKMVNVLFSSRPIELDGEKHHITHLIDITALKKAQSEVLALNQELETRVAKRTKQLEMANQELKTFTYSVSHDLKSPLRSIDGYGKLLLDSCGDKLDKDSLYFLERIRGATLKMNDLIDDLLEYSRLERKKMANENIYLDEFVNGLFSNYEEELNHGKYSVENKLPHEIFSVDKQGLAIALRNLIENSIKFTRSAKKPKIIVDHVKKKTSIIISVEDNGIGFNMKYTDKIFEIFQRLNKSEDFPGTGVGLALVKKAMQRMNGIAWAKSTPGTGAIFYLQVPN